MQFCRITCYQINRSMDKIKKCKSCPLFKNQSPLLSNASSADVFWVGLSAKKVSNAEFDLPLDSNTNSGKMLDLIEEHFKAVSFYRTNLVKCLPLDDNQKLRYPNSNEIRKCKNNLIYEIESLKPPIVFLLGKIVFNSILKDIEKPIIKELTSKNFKFNLFWEDNVLFVGIVHPSYVHIYRKKYKDEYVKLLVDIIKTELNK